MLGKFGPEVWVQECRVYILKADSRTLKTRRSEALNPKPIWIGDLWVFLQPRKFKILQKPTDSVRFLQISILQKSPTNPVLITQASTLGAFGWPLLRYRMLRTDCSGKRARTPINPQTEALCPELHLRANNAHPKPQTLNPKASKP